MISLAETWCTLTSSASMVSSRTEKRLSWYRLPSSTKISELTAQHSTYSASKNLLPLITLLTCSLQVLELMEGGSVIAVYNAARDAAGSSAGSWRPPAARALRYAAQLFRALEYLHGRLPALVHRDVKPGNLLVTADLETVKLADFGVSH